MIAPTSDALPIHTVRDRILSALSEQGQCVVTAPAGSGKSTGVAQFLLDEPGGNGRALILQPRRLAARHLAAFCARRIGEDLGDRIGYQVRFESRCTPKTRVVFETYGVLVRQMLADPRLCGVSTVVCDEFHERTLDMDLCLAWMARLRREQRTAPRLVVMSATIDVHAVASFLGNAPVIEAHGRAFPVDIRHQSPRSRESVAEQSARALDGALQGGLDGSVLVFMPGAAEIRATCDAVVSVCRRYGRTVRQLHGSLPLDEQMAIVEESGRGLSVIVSTNVAETSLTIPGITCVIDSGMERSAAYDPHADRNTLFVLPISGRSAEQRAGRAGRVAPGVCIRLWAPNSRSTPAEKRVPEIQRLELSGLALRASALCTRAHVAPVDPHVLRWLDAPEQSRWERSVGLLQTIGALSGGGDSAVALSPEGLRLADMPLDPLPARLLSASRDADCTALTAAALAVWESDDAATGGAGADLLDAAADLIGGATRPASSEAPRMLASLRDSCDADAFVRQQARIRTAALANDRDALLAEVERTARCWMRVLSHRIGVNDDGGALYAFSDGSTARIAGPAHATRPDACIALSVTHAAGAGRARQTTIARLVALRREWIAGEYPHEVRRGASCTWNDHRAAVDFCDTTTWRGLVLTRVAASGRPDPGAAVDLLSERVASGLIALSREESDEFVRRCRLAASVFPDVSAPAFDNDDWRLIYHDLCRGSVSANQVQDASLLAAVREYAGPAVCSRVDALLPLRVRLPSAKTGHVHYPESGPPELAARIGDLVGYRGPRFLLAEGRIEGIFDILAPNMRTVQKTGDLNRFWKDVYPQLKTQLRRKYPRHVWP